MARDIQAATSSTKVAQRTASTLTATSTGRSCACRATWHCGSCYDASLRVTLLGPPFAMEVPPEESMEVAVAADMAKVHVVPDGPDKRQWVGGEPLCPA